MNKHRPQVIFLIFFSVLHLGLALPAQAVSDPGMPLQLIVTPATVNRYTTKNMILRCKRNPDVETKIVEIYRIRILKHYTSGWGLYAQQRIIDGIPFVAGSATVLASITGDISNAFLQLSWDNIEKDCFAAFKCEVTGFNNDGNFEIESSAEFKIHEINNWIGHVESISKDAHQKISEIKKSTGSKFVNLQKELGEVKTFLRSLTQWPGGYYALLQPRTGCPVDLAFFGGTRKYLKIHTESQSSSDTANSHSSILPATALSSEGANKFFTLEFCEVTRQFSTLSWPKGSFCINKILHKSCPTGFHHGIVKFDGEDTNKLGHSRSNVAESASDPILYFCCQFSGSASDPIQLPTGSAFLLYRYGGECQSVHGMSVSEEFVQIDTENSGNADSITGSHPDVDRPGTVIKLHLCYYK